MKRWLGLLVIGWWLVGVAIGVRPTVEASLMGGGDNNTDGYLSNGGFEGDYYAVGAGQVAQGWTGVDRAVWQQKKRWPNLATSFSLALDWVSESFAL